MRRTTFKRARTWHYRKMRPCTDLSNGLVSLPLFPLWLDCIITTSGYDFRKGPPACGARKLRAAHEGPGPATVDTTVQPNVSSFPTDAKLLHAAIRGFNRLARQHGVRLRQSYLRVAKHAAMIPECLDHILVFGERYLRHLLRTYADYYNRTRTHLSLHKDLPTSRTKEPFGRIFPVPILGGLHHRYVRIQFTTGTAHRMVNCLSLGLRSRSRVSPSTLARRLRPRS